ncbi:MAG: DUF5681 domain-containing protein [Patescibacteria group bacterium]
MAISSTSFRKGQSGNLKGAPKRDWSWLGTLQEAVEKKVNSGESIKELVAKSLVNQALKGNVSAMKEIMNRMDGMPKQSTDLTSQAELFSMPVIYIPKQNDE